MSHLTRHGWLQAPHYTLLLLCRHSSSVAPLPPFRRRPDDPLMRITHPTSPAIDGTRRTSSTSCATNTARKSRSSSPFAPSTRDGSACPPRSARRSQSHACSPPTTRYPQQDTYLLSEIHISAARYISPRRDEDLLTQAWQSRRYLGRISAVSAQALLTPIFGLAVPLWGTAMLEAWRLQQKALEITPISRRYHAEIMTRSRRDHVQITPRSRDVCTMIYYVQELAALWSVEDLNEADVLRPEFRGERVVSRLTGDELLRNLA